MPDQTSTLFEAPILVLPRRVSLVSQTAQSLRDAIAAGHWHASLPGERELCATLHVSRHTLRAALVELQREGVVRATPRATRVLQPALQSNLACSGIVGVISRTPLRRISQTALLMIDVLREHLGQGGWTMQFHAGPAMFSAAPERALESLVARTPGATWLLHTSVRPMQEWFVRRSLRCLVIGTCMEDIPLPWVDADHFAAARHAGAMLLRNGHRRIALVRADEGTGGDDRSEAGLRQAVAAASDADVRIVRHHGRDHLVTLLDRGLRTAATPTAYYVLRATHALTVTMHLLRRGVRVPRDVAIISRDDEGFLEETSPLISRYTISPDQFARKIVSLIGATPTAKPMAPRSVQLMPRFVAGETL